MRRFLLQGIILISLLASTAGCQTSQPSQAPQSSQAQQPGTSGPTEIRVGVNTPLTGMFAGFGQGGTWGLKAAVEDVNKLGGVMVKDLGRKLPITLVIRDNESDPAKSATIEEDLILRDKVNFTSPPNQPLTLDIPQANLADRYKIPRVTGGNPMEGWLELRKQATPAWKYSWTYGFSIATPGEPGSYWEKPGYTIKDTWVAMLDRYGGQTNKKAAVFASDEPDGRAWYSLFPQILRDLGYTVVGIDKKLGLVPVETTDFSSMINEWKNNDVTILWGNAPAPIFGTMWKQARALGFQPKMVSIGRAPLFYTDVAAWGGDLPNGIGVEIWWDPSWEKSPGFGDTTPKTLAERWTKDSGQPLNPGIGWGYLQIQILADAIERAGSLDAEKVNAALATTDIQTIGGHIKFDANQHAWIPLVYGQWRKTDKPQKWELPVVFSKHDFIKPTAQPIFPIPYGN